MNLLLHAPGVKNDLANYYKHAFSAAVELFIVSAYLTDWDSSLKINSGCRKLRIIIGRDFGITRKAACEAILSWLPPGRKGQFLVVEHVWGFHPKAVVWKEATGKCYALVGSSNMTRAAFESNYEANAISEISEDAYRSARRWIDQIEEYAVPVSEDWLKRYKEGRFSVRPNRPSDPPKGNSVVVPLRLPRPKDMTKLLRERRKQIEAYKQHESGLMDLFKRCAQQKISSEEFYNELPEFWSWKRGDRLQGSGWERRGKNSDFRALSVSFQRIVDSNDGDRDDIVVQEIDRLADLKVPARTAFLSEILCLKFPKRYPVLNGPIWKYLKHAKFCAPRGASEGDHYIDLAKKLRSSLLQNPDHPAKSLAELDTVIWSAFGKK